MEPCERVGEVDDFVRDWIADTDSARDPHGGLQSDSEFRHLARHNRLDVGDRARDRPNRPIQLVRALALVTDPFVFGGHEDDDDGDGESDHTDDRQALHPTTNDVS